MNNILKHNQTKFRYFTGFLMNSFFVLTSYIIQAQVSKPFVSNNIFQTDCFIENKGQFNIILQDSLTPIDFAINHQNDEIYFNKNGFKYHIIKTTPRQETEQERNEDKLKEEKEEKEEKERIKYDVEEDWFTLEWIGANPISRKLGLNKTKHYFTYGTEEYNSYGYQEITYQNIYPNIDVKYELHEKGGVKYSFILHPHADIRNIQFKYSSQKGVNIQKEDNKIIISNPIGKLIESNIKAYYSNGEEVELDYTLDNNQIIQFKPLHPIDKNREFIIDPWVSAVTSLTGMLTANNKAYDVDYDLNGNLFAIGGGGGYGNTISAINLPKLAKYDNIGNLMWTFSGFNVSPFWSSSPLPNIATYGLVGNFVVDKSSNKIYMGQGFYYGPGASVIRLNNNGNYDNFISSPDPLYNEIWELKFNCTNGKLIAMGGSTLSNLNIGIIDTTTTLLTISNVTGNASYYQDIICADIDATGEVYTIFASYQTPAVNNKIFKLNSNYTANAWSTYSGFNTFVEGDNKPYISTNLGFSNGFNALSVNDQYLYYYDGFNIKAFNKSNGAAVGSSTSILVHPAKYQGGIFANECNEVFVGGKNGNIIKYQFNGISFVAFDTLLINGYAGKSVYDIVWNPLNNLLYVCGDGFVATVNPESTCPINNNTGNILLDVSLHCPDSALVSVLNPDTTIAYTFIWIDSTTNTTLQTITIPPGDSISGMSGLVPGHVIQVSVLKSSACQVLSNDTSFTLVCNGSILNILLCPGDSFMLSNSNYISAPGVYIDTFTNIFNQDSLVYVYLSNYPVYSITIYDTLCNGDNYVLPNNSIVNSAGTYIDSLSSIYGCDSIITTVLTYYPNISTTINATICSNQTYTLPNNTVVNTPGTYIDTISSTQGCDSIITTILTFYPNISTTINDTICSNQTYTLPNNTVVNTPGTYINTLISTHGCDSVITINLVVLPSFLTYKYDTICDGQTYVLPDLTVTNLAGVYTSTFNSQFNCDSTIIVHLHVLPELQSTELITLCEQSGYQLPNGNTVQTSGVYISNLVNVQGCDSIVTSYVNFYNNTYSQNNVTICENKNYELPDGLIVNTEGAYISKITNVNGCDSIITTHIKVQKLPLVDLGNDTMLCGNSGIRLDIYTPNAFYLWDDGSRFSHNTLRNYGVHYVAVTKHPCEPVTDSITILECTCKIFIPNAFSPNNDNANDIFKPLISCSLDPEYYTFQVFNRYGEVVFYTTIPNEDGWDGTYKLVAQGIGTYYYLLKFKNPKTGEMEVYKGDVTLIR